MEQADQEPSEDSKISKTFESLFNNKIKNAEASSELEEPVA